MKSFEMFNKKFWLYSIAYGCVCLIVCTIPVLLTQGGSVVDFTKTGQIGDTIGGIMGPFIAMIAAYLTFIAFWAQYYANKQQRDDIAIERFNQTFFSLMNMHEQITNSLEFTILRKDDNPISHKGRELFSYAFENKAAVNQVEENKYKEKSMRTLLQENDWKSYESYQLPTYFDHYFRNMYRIIKYVDETKVFDNMDNPLDKKYEYVAILRSTLSRYELVWLFYNCLSEYGQDKFKPLVEKYALLKNLRPELLINKDDIKEYNQTAFGLDANNN
jgi:hypothetical protein